MEGHILFVEDDANLQQAVTFILERDGFTVETAATGLDAVDKATRTPPDLVLLDLNLPDIDGYEVCRRLKGNPSTRGSFVLMATARRQVDDIVEGLECYADDYLTKPYQPRLLLARIHALLRRRTGQLLTPAAVPEARGALVIDDEAHRVRVRGEEVHLTRSEYALLSLLVKRANRVLTRTQILDEIRGYEFAVTERVVDFLVSGLRKKLKEDGACIETVRGVGYRYTPNLMPGKQG